MKDLRFRRGVRSTALLVLAACLVFATPAIAEMSKEELAKAAQNPVANLFSVPFQNSTNFNVGPYNRTQDIQNIQPVIPFTLDPEWNVITRTIVPLIWQPGIAPGQDTGFGPGDIQIHRVPVAREARRHDLGRRPHLPAAGADPAAEIARGIPQGAWSNIREKERFR